MIDTSKYVSLVKFDQRDIEKCKEFTPDPTTTGPSA